MKLKIVSPSKAIVEDATREELISLYEDLTYNNTAKQHLVKRHYGNHWLKSKDKEAWDIKLKELKADVKKTVIFREDGKIFIRPGSIPYLTNRNLQVENHIIYPTPKKVPWSKPLPFSLHGYQEESWQKLVKEAINGPTNVELCTGAGKSAILLKICRETGFKTAIIAPSKSIFNELLEKFEYHFGKKLVGRFGDGKKVLGKRFTICISDSIVNIKPGTEEWEFFSNLEMLLVDESHTFGADTLEGICHGVLKDIPYRSFLSGTQTRGDGAEKLLYSIIGKTIHTLSTQEAVAGGFICPHEYRIVELESSDPNFNSADNIEMKRIHFLRNKNIAAFTAKLANVYATQFKMNTLILVEELGQISSILPMIMVPVAVAHSEKRKDRLIELGISKVDPKESVDKFNKNEVQVLIGTSCISTGTNIYPTHNTVNWQGGSSEIKTRQGAIGRSVRLGEQNPWKSKCPLKEKAIIWDFNVQDNEVMAGQLENRIECYLDSGSEIKHIKFKK